MSHNSELTSKNPVPRRAWSTLEVRALLKGWADGLRGADLAARIANATGLQARSVPSVESAALRLGLRSGKPRPWSQEERDFLVELRRRRLSFELAAAEFFSKGWGDRTPEALRVALRRSGKRPSGPRAPMSDWTREDRKLLGRLRRKGLTWAQVAEGISRGGIQRTPAACKVQAVSFRKRGGVT